MKKQVIDVHFLLFSTHCRKEDSENLHCRVHLRRLQCCVAPLQFQDIALSYLKFFVSKGLPRVLPTLIILHLWPSWTQNEGWKETFWGNELIIQTWIRFWGELKAVSLRDTWWPTVIWFCCYREWERTKGLFQLLGHFILTGCRGHK